MTLLEPRWLFALGGAAAIFLLYLIRSRYRRLVVSSTVLWRSVPRDVVAHTSWRRARWELLLLLQLAIGLLVALALARPSIPTTPRRSLAVVVDLSSSMRATDVAPTRFEAARRAAGSIIGSASQDDWISLIAAGAHPRVEASGSKDRALGALDGLQVEDDAGDMDAAIRIATGEAGARDGFRGEVVVVTDGAFALDVALSESTADVSFRLIGGQSDNVAISGVSLRRPLESGRDVPGFATAVNFGATPITAPVVVYADGVQVDSREVTLPARGRTELSFQVPRDARTVRVGLLANDALAADNSVEIRGPAEYQRTVLLVSDSPAVWERALDAVPYVTRRTVAPADYDASMVTPETIVVFDGSAPRELPKVPLVLVGDPSPLAATTGPGHASRAEDVDTQDPLLRGLDLTPLTTTRAYPTTIAEWAAAPVTDAAREPLVMHGVVDGRRVVTLTFDTSGSNLAQLAAFPLLVSNIVDWLTPGRADEVQAGSGARADITPRAQLTNSGPAGPRVRGAYSVHNVEIWPFLVGAALALLVLEWYLGARSSLELRRAGLVMFLRLCTSGCLALALVRPAVTVPDDALDVAVALDTSASMSAEARQAAASWFASAMEARRPHDRVALVSFAADARVLRVPEADSSPVAVTDSGDNGKTNLALALRVSAGLARPSGRVVLLSDGRATTGDLDAALGQAADVPVDVVPLNGIPSSPMLAIDHLDVPAYVRAGETFDGTVVVNATQATAAALQISVDGQQTSDQDLQLSAGTNRIALSQTLEADGFHRISARLAGPAAADSADAFAQAFVVVEPVPRVLVIEERPGEGAPIQAALRAAALRIDLRNPDQLPDPRQLEAYAAVVLANVSATSFTLDQQKELRTFVEANGHGLVVMGGTTSYGLGSYADSILEQVLPVTSTVPPSREDARLALLLIIDNSQSMSRKSDGISSIEMAREAAILAMKSIGDRDQIGVLSFNHRFKWLVEMGAVGQIGRELIENRIAQLEPEGGTEIFTALSEGAQAMLATRADLRHIVLFTDGQSRQANYDPLLARLRQQKIGLSTIGLGPEADTQLLSSLAKLGEGRYYFTERIPELPRIMAREIAISKRSAQVEGTIQPQLVSASPILRGFAPSDLPPLTGFVATTPRDEAQTVLATEDGRPLLAQWHLGLGRTVSWTSDPGSAWSAAWAQWSGNARLWEQAVRWAMGPPVQRDFRVQTRVVGHEATITLDDARDGHFADLENPVASVVDPAGRPTDVPLRQVAPGRYTATVIGEVPGAYEVQVRTHPSNPADARVETSGFSLRLNPELATFGSDEHALRRIASETGGRVLSDPASAFRADGRALGQRSEPIWQLIALLGLLLFVLEVALRRLGLSLRALRLLRR